jgi:hypothetical protein
MWKNHHKTPPINFVAIIRYVGEGKMRPEFSQIIKELGGVSRSVTLRNLRRNDNETIHDAAVRYVRREFEAAARSYRMKLDSRPFEIPVKID